MIEKYLNNRFLILYFFPFILGSLTMLTFEPFNFSLINLIIFPIFFYLLVYINKKSRAIYRKKTYKKNFFICGLAFGFGFYLCGVSWITNSLTFDKNFQVFIPFALILIPLFLSLFLGFATLLVGKYLKLDFPSILILSSSLAVSDYLRGHVLTGFPWNLWSYSTVSMNEVAQIVNHIGLYSYNLLVITTFFLPVIFFFKISVTRKMISLISAFFIILGLYIFGNYEINKNKKILKNIGDRIHVKVISPNFNLEYGLSAEDIEMRFKKLIRYSDPDKNKNTLFIWPEGVFSGYNYDEILTFKNLIFNNFSNKHYILFGVNTLDSDRGGLYNSMLIVNNKFEIIQSYNKRKLVPFGEFLPFEGLLNSIGLKKITEGHGSFLKGQKDNNLVIEKLNILPLICYEIIFPNLIQKSDTDTNLIINISEDGWFGKTVGPDQHYAKAIFRAIENNTFVLRSTNRGVSAIINNKGKSVKRINRNEAGNIEFDVPLIKSNKIKNDLIFFILLITYLLIFLIYKKQNE